MTYLAVLIIMVILIAVIVGALFGPVWLKREKPQQGAGRERYGPPPGMNRALSHEELGDRGWPGFPFEYTANTASSISHMIERSA